MQVQNQTQQIAEEELLLSLSEDELDSITGGFDAGGPIAEPIGKAVGAVVGGFAGFSVGGPVGAGVGVVGGQELGGLAGRLAGKGLSAIHHYNKGPLAWF